MNFAAVAPRTRGVAIALVGVLLIAVNVSAQQIDCAESLILGQEHAKASRPVLGPFLLGAAGAIVGGAMASALIVQTSAQMKGMGLYEAALAGAVLGAFWPLVGVVAYTAVSSPSAPLNPDPDTIIYQCFVNGYEQAARTPRMLFAILGGGVGIAAVFGVASLVATQVYGAW